MDIELSQDRIALSFLKQSKLSDFFESLGLSKNQQKKFYSNEELTRIIVAEKEISIPINLVNNGKINPVYTGENIEVIYDDENFLVLNKPFTQHGHPQSYQETDTCLNFIASKDLAPTLNFKGAEKGLLYRLDFQTSGVLVYVKDFKIHHELRENFKNIAKQKTYLAIVQGDYPDSKSHLSHSLVSYGPKGKKMVEGSDGNTVHLDIQKIAYEKEYSFLKISLQEGIRHQIRAQLSLSGYPILGDTLYGGSKAKRVFLHAYEYKILWKNDLLSFKASSAGLFQNFFDLDSLL